MVTYLRFLITFATYCCLIQVGSLLSRGAETQPGLEVLAEVWPEADKLFHRDPSWLGGDDAYSLDLGNGRVAWFFGDSFVAPTTAGERRGTTMVHNSVGIQAGYDPTTAKFKAYWRRADGRPTSFFPDDGIHYFWPGGSLLVNGKLLVFFMRSWTRDSSHAMGFETDGWAATLVDNISRSPNQWRLRRLDVPQNELNVLVGSAAVVRDGEHLVAFSVGGKKHQVYLVRWRWEAAAVGDLSQPEWWVGAERGWVAQSKLSEPPVPVIKNGQTEFSVFRSPDLKCYLQFQFSSYPVSPICLRTAERLIGPWSEPRACIRETELMQAVPNLMLYAVKVHPELTCDGLALTYASNTTRLEQLLDSSTIYYPRFLRVKLNRPAP